MKKTTYTYYNANGTIAYTKTRTDYEDGTKKFYFEQIDGTKGIKDTQHELYNLPDVLTATKVYFVEGEKCADAVIKQGFVATTLDTGAKSPWCSHYAEYLKDKEVIIIPDNDTPGMNYAKKILLNVPTARIVKLPDLAEKGDIYDWLAMGHTMAEVDELPTFEITEDVATTIHSDTVPNVLSRRLNGLKSNLQEAGISFKTSSKMNGTEIVLTNEKIPQLSSYPQYGVKFDGTNAPVSMADDTQDDTDMDDVTF